MIKLLAATAPVALVMLAAAHAAPKTADDPYLWLEEIEGAKAIEWAKAHNAASEPVLQADSRFQPMLEEAKTILNSTARIPDGHIENGEVYNFWQGPDHVRGVWRRASVKSYKSGNPEWETVLDYDKMAADEERNWVAESRICLTPEFIHCMIEVSDGGKDAGYWREFNTETKTFVDGGFYLPEAKSSLAWVDADTLLVGTDTGEGSLTDSGYARTLRVWKRGDDFADSKLYFEGDKSDVGVFADVEHDGDKAYIIGQQATSFFETKYHFAPSVDAESTILPLPLNSDLYGVLAGRAIFLLREKWSYRGADYPVGDIVAYDLATGDAERVISPKPNQAFDNDSLAIGKKSILVQYLEDVSGKAARLMRKKSGEWKLDRINVPDNGVVKIISAGGGTDDALLTFENPVTPTTLYFADKKNKLKKVMAMPAFYDADGVVVEQRFASSKDGTKVPYYVIGKKDVIENGDAPAVQYGYGGFLIPILPVYYENPARPQHGALAGKMWVSRGGVLVLSNIRGGSEYGPKWHSAALKEHRQRAYDDFIAIGEDLVASGLTTPEKLGAIGRSNGGLLMGVMMTERPDLYHAIDCGVPLLDMKRYTKLGAGASWIGEYGDPDIPDEWAYISEYSPYQNLKKGVSYPKALFYTSTKDDRVHPGHARKMAAKMEAMGYPFFYYENLEGGHGGTSNQDQLAYRTALEWAYFAHMLMPEAAAE